MKRRLVISVLLATVLLLIPSMALAGDPPDTTVDVGIVSPGDVGFNADVNAGGDVAFSIDGVGIDSIIGTATLMAMGDGDEWTYHQVRTNKRNIAVLFKVVGNDMTHDIAEAKSERILIADALLKNIVEDEESKKLFVTLEASVVGNDEQIQYLIDYASWLAGEHSSLGYYTSNELARLEYEAYVADYQASITTYQLRQTQIIAISVVGALLAVVIVLCVLVGGLRRKIKYLV